MTLLETLGIALGLAMEGDRATIQVFLVRSGRLSGREAFHLRAPADPSPSDVIGSFLTQYYANASSIPAEILLPTDVADADEAAAWLSSLRGSRVRLVVPKRGEKRHLVALAEDNALFALKGSAKEDAVKADAAAALVELADALSLSGFPQRIEAFDISNTQGGEATGSVPQRVHPFITVASVPVATSAAA